MNNFSLEPYESYAYSLLCRMVAEDTTNPPGNEEQLAVMLGKELMAAGAEVSVQTVAENRANLIARIKGKDQGPTLVLTGHLDVVAPGAGWTTNPFQVTRAEGRLIGRGVVDMKGGIAAQIAAVRKLADSNAIRCGELVLCYVADEESRSQGLQKAWEQLEHVDYAVIGEPTELKAAVCHKGVTRMKVTISGKGGHAARPWSTVNPIEDIPVVVDAVAEINRNLAEKVHPLLGCGTLTLTTVHAGNKGNQIPSSCEIKLDRRLLPGETIQEACREVEDLLTKHFEGRRATVSVEPYLATGSGSVSPDSRIVQETLEVSTHLFGFKDAVAFDGCCEQTFWEAAGVDAIIFGPGSLDQAHAADESMEEVQLYDAVRGYEELVQKLLGN